MHLVSPPGEAFRDFRHVTKRPACLIRMIAQRREDKVHGGSRG